jgi:hypothetical protein
MDILLEYISAFTGPFGVMDTCNLLYLLRKIYCNSQIGNLMLLLKVITTLMGGLIPMGLLLFSGS